MGTQENGGSFILRWAHLIVILTVQLLLAGAVWGSLQYRVAELERRMEVIEKRSEDNFLSRVEFEKRHEDLQKRVEELREEVQQMEFQEPPPKARRRGGD